MSVFTYVEIVLVSRIFGNHKGKKVMLKIFSYFFFFYHGILLLAVLGLLSAVTYYVQKLNGTLSVDGLAELVFSEGRLSPLSKALMVILLAVQVHHLFPYFFLLRLIFFRLH